MNELAALFRVIGFFLLVGLGMVAAVAVAIAFCVCLIAYGVLLAGTWVGARLRR